MDIGLHVTTGSRDGYGQVAPKAGVCVSLVGGAFDEVGVTCYRIYRPREVYLNGPPEWDTTSVADMPALADQWWPHLLARTQEIEAAHGDIDALQLTNEMVGNNAENARKLVAYEGRLMDHAEAAGYTLCVGNLSANSPDWNSGVWQDILAPFIRDAWARGHVYSRHVYFDIEPLADNWNRAFQELDYLREQGPTGGVVLTELGFVNFPGAADLIAGLREYAEAAASYPEIGLGAIFTYGDWSGGEGNANIEAASPQLADYLEAPDEKWQPPTVEPEEPMDVIMPTVSHHQGAMNWPAAKDSGVDVALIRLSIGTTKDSRADENFDGAAEAGVLRQPFHYLRLRAQDPPWWQQILFFVQELHKLDPRPELPPVIDVEDEDADPAWLSWRVLLSAWLLDGFLRTTTEVYTAAWWWNPRIGRRTAWQRNHPLHVAHFDVDEPTLPAGWATYRWHQYDCSAYGPAWGASSPDICLSRFNGTREEFELAYGLREPEPEPAPISQPGALNRDWNIRWRPELAADAVIGLGDAGQPVTVIGETTGDSFNDDPRWYALRVFAHQAGIDLDEEPEPQPPPSGSVTFPVGTAAEREAATDGWPGAWFDANPYGNYYHVRDGHYAYHTGADLNLNEPTWDSDRGKPVFAIADGEVSYAGRWNDAWGIIIVIDHDGFYSRYSAVDGLEVAVGDVVDAGQQIAVIDQHGEGEPYHLHFDISTTERLAENPGDWPGTDLDRLHRDYVPPLPFILERLGAAPVGIDLLPYFMGAHGRSIELAYDWAGGGTHPLQVQHGDGVFWYVKGDNGEFEELWAGDQYIYRGIDTSEAHDKYYVQYTPLPDRLAYGARWIPRFMRVGETAEFSPYVVHYWQADCSPRGIQGQPLNRISLLAVHDSYTFPSGITLDDVIEVGWEGQERYWFSGGLVGWEGEGVGRSYISQIHDDRPLTRNVPGCWQTPERYRG